MTHRNPHGSGAKGPDELRHQIEQARSRLGRADVKGRALTRAADLRDKAGAATVQLRSSATQAVLRHPRPLMVAGAAGAALATVGVLRRRHH
ncbi:hypothetical protein J2Z21_006297 [Streptomyces griseochromogenes]|uniref:DUF3618 domain-containing protein n=1 Tax=Streptomyces griseochromogenes TaxID=68214 RepID=A0A1B1B6A0_9ACTN|nr:hypothetical protein [Streptomyces griseochromogenes]ANP54329.1 hypothetical protein AVL59_36365 [Streptomyces griseochromogenes]MBP2053305.1 hypothetical protein [Streptomyces griseochromogenes]